jgi:putative ABC transport system permease protein
MNLARIRKVVAISLRLCIIEIVSNRERTIISTLGIFLGVASLLANIAFVRGMEHDVQENMVRIGGLNIITIREREPVNREEKLAFQRSPGLSVEGVGSVTAGLPYVEEVIPLIDFGWERVQGGGRRRGSPVKAIAAPALRVYNYSAAEGRLFDSTDELRNRRVCVIGSALQKRLFEGPAIGRNVLFRGVAFEVVGIIETGDDHNRRARECLIPYGYYANRMGGHGRRVGEVSVMLTDSRHATTAQEQLTRRIFSAHRGVEDFEIDSNLDKVQEMQTATAGLRVVLWCVAAISLIVGGVSIANVMFATIGNRIREIGIRKALGAQKSDLFLQFLLESVLVSAVGSLPGLLLGGAVTRLPEKVFPFTPVLQPADYGAAMVVMMLIGAVSGLFPALRAAGMKPIEALRY